jgi:hypothetical protein
VNVVGRVRVTSHAAGAAARKKAITVGRATLSITAGHHAKITFALNRQGATLLRARRRLAVRTTTTTRAGDSPSSSLVRNLTVKRPRSAAEAQRRR